MELNLKAPVRFAPQTEDDYSENSVGGIINKGKLAWIARGSLFEIYCAQTGVLQYQYHFDKGVFGTKRGIIKCVDEFSSDDSDRCLLAIGLEFETPPHGMLVLFSVNKWMIIRCVSVNLYVSCCKFISRDIIKESPLHMFQEMLALGCKNGKIVLLNMSPALLQEPFLDTGNLFKQPICNIIPYSIDGLKVLKEKMHDGQDLGITLPGIDNFSTVLCLTPVKQLMALLVGCENGLLVFYDTTNFQIFNVLQPKERNAPLHHIAFVEPIDDPRSYAYIWTLHGSRHKPLAIMHSLLYSRKYANDNGCMIYENFQSCNRVLEITSLNVETHTQPIVCQPLIEQSKLLSLCFLGWRVKDGVEIFLFDINQWYKENMPRFVDIEDNPSFLVPFYSRNCNFVLDLWINSETIKEFRWAQRPEEYCFPISLSYDCLLLQKRGSVIVSWPGLQKCALNMLQNGGALAFLDPTPFYVEMVKSSLIPENYDLDIEGDSVLVMRREMLLSIALEYKCTALLRECVTAWSDGSHFGQVPYKGLSISTLTEWIWERAKVLTERCCSIVAPLFDNSGMIIGEIFKKTLVQAIWQLKFLSLLLSDILCKCNRDLPQGVFRSLTTNKESIDMVVKYHEVIQFFEKIGLLPERERNTMQENDDDKCFISVSYPYQKLKSFYETKRLNMERIQKNNFNSKSGGCPLLFIDKFMEMEYNSAKLKKEWIECGGDGLYPPPSFQAMLRTLLVPNVLIEKKYELFVYFFFDLSLFIGEKFPDKLSFDELSYIFKQNPFVRNAIKAFWNLDHGNFKDIWYAIPSPPQHRKFSSWEIQLLLESLLLQNQTKYACHILRFIRTPIDPLLELKIYLANSSVSDAFAFVRSKMNLKLLREFFKHCLGLGKCELFCSLFLTEEEEETLHEVVDSFKSLQAHYVYLAYLLRKNDFIKASTCFRKLNAFANRKEHISNGQLEIANDLLTFYKKTMNPHTRKLFEHHLRNGNVKENSLTVTNFRKQFKLAKAPRIYSEIIDETHKHDQENNSKVKSNFETDALNLPLIRCIYRNGPKLLHDAGNTHSFSSILKRKNNDNVQSVNKKLASIEEIENQKSTRFYLNQSKDTIYTETEQFSECLDEEQESVVAERSADTIANNDKDSDNDENRKDNLFSTTVYENVESSFKISRRKPLHSSTSKLFENEKENRTNELYSTKSIDKLNKGESVKDLNVSFDSTSTTSLPLKLAKSGRDTPTKTKYYSQRTIVTTSNLNLSQHIERNEESSSCDRELRRSTRSRSKLRTLEQSQSLDDVETNSKRKDIHETNPAKSTTEDEDLERQSSVSTVEQEELTLVISEDEYCKSAKGESIDAVESSDEDAKIITRSHKTKDSNVSKLQNEQLKEKRSTRSQDKLHKRYESMEDVQRTKRATRSQSKFDDASELNDTMTSVTSQRRSRRLNAMNVTIDEDDDDRKSVTSQTSVRSLRRRQSIVHRESEQHNVSAQNHPKTRRRRASHANEDHDEQAIDEHNKSLSDVNEEDDKQSTRNRKGTGRPKKIETLATPRRSLRPRRTSTDSVASNISLTPVTRSKRRMSTSTDG